MSDAASMLIPASNIVVSSYQPFSHNCTCMQEVGLHRKKHLLFKVDSVYSCNWRGSRHNHEIEWNALSS
jgi:hypothetical protein